MAFDHLAAQINQNLDYPILLAENGVQGNARLDLIFDSLGEVIEEMSFFTGTHRAIRGLLVKASRVGIVEWYRSDAYRLHREDFKNQHFTAELSLSVLSSETKWLRGASGEYQLVRRHRVSACAFARRG